MSLQDINHGGTAGLWFVIIILFIISILLLAGKGVNLIAGYNTATEEQKKKVDTKKLGAVIGTGLMLVGCLMLVMTAFQSVLPAWFAYVALTIILVDCVVMIVLANTICKKKDETEENDKE